ncbi:MAG: hypothetical protein RLY71_1059 [Pseudomonadota bacterium]|jgi:hypothetical protein
MSPIEIPLLRESVAFARRLVQAAQVFGQPRYHFHRRANWSYRYSETFYARESALFQADANAYLHGHATDAPQLDDVYARRLRGKQVFTVVAKVLAHTLFAWLGSLCNRTLKRDGVGIYRKAYVDDIELVFDQAQASVVRAVYPFPINVRRQWRYLRFLRRQGHRFKLAGNPYLLGDFWGFLCQRDVRSLMRMESRAQVRHAREVMALGVHTVQLSDEFDIGSLDFARALGHIGLHVVNSAHGVGKYFPVHAYREFHFLTEKQVQYYHAIRACTYKLRLLNDRSGSVVATDRGGVDLVWLSQTFSAAGDIVAENESLVLAHLHAELGGMPGVNLFFKPHPNSKMAEPPIGFNLLGDLAKVNGGLGTVFASFFSTCQIDPAFKGCKVLVSGRWIHPGIAFDDAEPMFDMAGLVTFVLQFAKERSKSELS